MRRLAATIVQDMTIQFRNGFYLASGVVMLVWLGLWQLVPAGTPLPAGLIIPTLVVLNLVFTAFYFMAALVLLEKGQGVLWGLAVTPLRRGEYLLGKIISLAWLALLESGLFIGLMAGWHWNPVWLIAGLLYSCCLYGLLAYLTVSRYQAINDYLLPSGLIVAFLQLPLLDHLGLWNHWLFYFHPLRPGLWLMQAAFEPLPAGQMLLALLAGTVWLALTLGLARRIDWQP